MAGIPPFARRKSVQLVAVGLAGIAVGAGSGGGSTAKHDTAPAPQVKTVTHTVTKTHTVYRTPHECIRALETMGHVGQTYNDVLGKFVQGTMDGTLTPAQVEAMGQRIKTAGEQVKGATTDAVVCEAQS